MGKLFLMFCLAGLMNVAPEAVLAGAGMYTGMIGVQSNTPKD